MYFEDKYKPFVNSGLAFGAKNVTKEVPSFVSSQITIDFNYFCEKLYTKDCKMVDIEEIYELINQLFLGDCGV